LSPKVVGLSGSGETVTIFASEVQPGWDIGGNANGGYLMAIASLVMFEGDVRQEIIRLLGTFGEQTPGGPSYIAEGPVDIPDYDDCELPPAANEGPKPAMMERLAVRIYPGDEGFRNGTPTGEARIRGWFAFADHEPIDAIGLLLVADAFSPPVFNTELPVGWAPTVELTVHIRGVPAPGPLRCSFRSRFVHDGMLDEDGEIWDSSGVLVAQSRQLALAPRPPT
jgi:hypothetical protein